MNRQRGISGIIILGVASFLTACSSKPIVNVSSGAAPAAVEASTTTSAQTSMVSTTADAETRCMKEAHALNDNPPLTRMRLVIDQNGTVFSDGSGYAKPTAGLSILEIEAPSDTKVIKKPT